MTGEHIQHCLDHLSQSFHIDVSFLSEDLSLRTDPLRYATNHQRSPRLILLGSDHAYLDGIRCDLYNAIADVSLLRIKEVEDDELLFEITNLDIAHNSSVSSRSTPESKILSMESNDNINLISYHPATNSRAADFETTALEANELEIVVYNQPRTMHSEVSSFEAMSRVDFEDGGFLDNLNVDSNIVMTMTEELDDNNIDFGVAQTAAGGDLLLATGRDLRALFELDIDGK